MGASKARVTPLPPTAERKPTPNLRPWFSLLSDCHGPEELSPALERGFLSLSYVDLHSIGSLVSLCKEDMEERLVPSTSVGGERGCPGVQCSP